MMPASPRKLISLMVLVLLMASPSAFAHAHKPHNIAERWDARGDRIDARLDRAAAEQSARGHAGRARALDAKGDKINHRLDVKGQCREARFDHRPHFHRH